jgi:hypothetical protein
MKKLHMLVAIASVLVLLSETASRVQARPGRCCQFASSTILSRLGVVSWEKLRRRYVAFLSCFVSPLAFVYRDAKCTSVQLFKWDSSKV